MELYHYTDDNRVINILRSGLQPLHPTEDTKVINDCLQKYSTNKETLIIRQNAIYFYNMKQFDEEEELPKDIRELKVLIKDLDVSQLYVANWKYAEMIFRFAKMMNDDDFSKELEEELQSYVASYISSIKRYESKDDIYVYPSTELLYIGEIEPKHIRVNEAIGRLITPFSFVSEKVNQYKEDFPKLYHDFQKAEKNKKRYVTASDESYQEYLELVKKYLVVKTFPDNNKEVEVTNHEGGVGAGFYENGKWWYRTGSDEILEEESYVIHWEKEKR